MSDDETLAESGKLDPLIDDDEGTSPRWGECDRCHSETRVYSSNGRWTCATCFDWLDELDDADAER